MENERRSIATQRHRDPIIAQAINAFGLTLACLAPLALAAYVIFLLNRSGDNNEALNELLVMEMTADQPKLLATAPPSIAAIEHKPSPEVADESVQSEDA